MELQRPTAAQDGRTPHHLAAAMRAAVADILRFQDFAAALQLRNFLQYIVEETLAGREDQLKERNIAVHALSRQVDFDPRLDCVVRVMAGKLRRALERYYHGPGATAEWRIDVPRGGYRPVFERVRPDHGQTQLPSSLPPPSGLVTVTTRQPVLAVMPFLPLTSGSEELALAEALACEACVKLRGLRGLEVLDYLITRRWLHGNGDEPDPSHAHQCDLLLGGTCRRQGPTVRLTVQLTSVNDGHLCWAGQFDVPSPSDDFASEDAIVAAICRGVGAVLERTSADPPHSRSATSLSRPRRNRTRSAAPAITVFPESERHPAAAPKH